MTLSGYCRMAPAFHDGVSFGWVLSHIADIGAMPKKQDGTWLRTYNDQ
jgi:hypothetical protein